MFTYCEGGEKMRRDFKKGQSILEYTLLLGAVITVIVVALFGGVKGKIQGAYDKAGDAIQSTTDDLTAGIFKGTN